MNGLNGEEDLNHNGRLDQGERDPNQFNNRALPFLMLLLGENTRVDDCKSLSLNRGISGEKLANLTDKNCYNFEVAEASTVAIISTGILDLQGQLFEISNGKLMDIDADNDGVADPGDRRISNEFTDKAGVVHNNFMLRPGNRENIRMLPAGTYRLLVSLDSGTISFDGTYGLLLLRRPAAGLPMIEDFFDGLKALLNQDGDYVENDYLDIYVRALFPDIYDTNWGNSVDYGGIIKERQCKALTNFYVYYIAGQGQHMYDDCTINDHFSINNPDWVLRGPAITIYNNTSNPTYGSEDNTQMGDVWVKDMGLTCSNGAYVSGYNHYGLCFYDTRILDSNWDSPMDGKLRISATRQPNKIVRTQ